jgi:ABC-2 type transport system permease protein
MSQSIIKSFIDNYSQTFSALTSISNNDPAKYHELLESLGNRQQYIKEVSGTSAPPNNILAYFYSLIAMSCFYGSMLGSREITDIEASISPLASRVNIAPIHKLKTFLYSSGASLLIHFSEMLVFIAYLFFVLKVDFGTKAGLVLLTTFIGSVAGISFGALVSAAVKKSEGIKIAILIGSSMICSALAGMMYQNLKYIIQQNIPILGWINPINLLTDAFYCLYYYDSLSRYTLNIIGLLVVIVLFSTGTYFMIRRRKYASL